MKKKLVAIVVVFVMAASLSACGAGEETTLTGMVVSVDGTVISLMEMDAGNMDGKDFAGGKRPENSENMEGFDPENFDPEAFNGTLPNGETLPQRGDGERPEMPEGMEPPEGMTMPEGTEPPEGMTMPENGQIPDFGSMGGMGFGNFDSDAETKNVDIGDAHISVEIDGGKASGSINDIKAGTFVTITMNGKGEVTNVLVSSRSGFGGGRQGL